MKVFWKVAEEYGEIGLIVLLVVALVVWGVIGHFSEKKAGGESDSVPKEP